MYKVSKEEITEFQNKLQSLIRNLSEHLNNEAAGLESRPDLMEFLKSRSDINNYAGVKDLLCALLLEEVRQYAPLGVLPTVVDKSGRRGAGAKNIRWLYNHLPVDRSRC